MSMLALGFAMFLSGPFAGPTSLTPQVTEAETRSEAQRQTDFTLDARLAELDRLDAVGFRLFRANAELCPDTGLSLGTATILLGDLKGPLKEAAVRRWGASEDLIIQQVIRDGPAAEAGLLAGDGLIGIEDQTVAGGKKAQALWRKQLAQVMESRPSSVRLRIRRGGEVREIVVKPARICAYDLVLDNESREINAYADGHRVVVTRPLLRLASTDEQLALVVGHELAHNARRHLSVQHRNARVGMLGGAALDILIAAASGVNTQGAFTKAGGDLGAGMYAPEFEAEADYVGLYFVARAGYATEGVETFWRKMAAEDPASILLRSSHPPTAERYLAIAAAEREIDGKLSRAEPLRPEEKAAPAATPAAGVR